MQVSERTDRKGTGLGPRPASERDVVVHAAGLEGRGGGGGAAFGRTAARLAWPRKAAAGAFPVIAAVEHGEGGVKPLQDDLGRILVDAVLLPFPGLQRALDINLAALL